MFHGAEPLDQLPDGGLTADLDRTVIEGEPQGIADAEQFLAECSIAAQFIVDFSAIADDVCTDRHVHQDFPDDALLRCCFCYVLRQIRDAEIVCSGFTDRKICLCILRCQQADRLHGITSES